MIGAKPKGTRTTPATPDPCLQALARCRDIAAHQVRAFVGGVMEWIVKGCVETREARADIAARPRVRSCNSPPKPITLAQLRPLNLGRRAALHGRHETSPYYQFRREGECPDLTSSDPRWDGS